MNSSRLLTVKTYFSWNVMHCNIVATYTCFRRIVVSILRDSEAGINAFFRSFHN